MVHAAQATYSSPPGSSRPPWSADHDISTPQFNVSPGKRKRNKSPVLATRGEAEGVARKRWKCHLWFYIVTLRQKQCMYRCNAMCHNRIEPFPLLSSMVLVNGGVCSSFYMDPKILWRFFWKLFPSTSNYGHQRKLISYSLLMLCSQLYNML